MLKVFVAQRMNRQIKRMVPSYELDTNKTFHNDPMWKPRPNWDFEKRLGFGYLDLRLSRLSRKTGQSERTFRSLSILLRELPLTEKSENGYTLIDSWQKLRLFADRALEYGFSVTWPAVGLTARSWLYRLVIITGFDVGIHEQCS